MAPIAASSQSKSKLKSFQYEPKDAGHPAFVEEADKENVPCESEKAISRMIPPPQPQPLSQRSATKDVRDCPQTPLGRLPLSDLLATGEDTSHAHLNLTPIERVLWENSPLSSGPPNSLPARRGRKRAHSSSPASSSQNETSNHFAKEKNAVDLEALQRALKTPKADPADDLWTRYSLNTGNIERLSPTAPAGVGFSHLMQSSSPQTPASHVSKDSGGLRRALSCIEWPTSAAKRRKLFHHNSQRTPAANHTDADGRGSTIERSKSRVSLLVDKLHDGFNKPTTRYRDYSSSEPAGSSPHADRDCPPSSPRKDDESADQENQEAIDAVVNVLSQTAVVPRATVPPPLVLSDEEIANLEKAESSDFDDDDLDLEMMENIETETKENKLTDIQTTDLGNGDEETRTNLAAEATTNETGINQTGNAGNHQRRVPDTSDDYSDVSFPSVISSSAVKAALPNDDEFDDDENDVFAADLEDVCAKYDSQIQHQAFRNQENKDAAPTRTETGPAQDVKPKRLSATTVQVEVLSDDEDFGSDSDFEQIAAECAEATQEQQVSQPQSSVRTLKYGSFIVS